MSVQCHFQRTDNHKGNASRSPKIGYYYIPTSLKNVTVTGTKISNYAFFNCASLENVTLKDTVTSVGTWAFENCNASIVYN